MAERGERGSQSEVDPKRERSENPHRTCRGRVSGGGNAKACHSHSHCYSSKQSTPHSPVPVPVTSSTEREEKRARGGLAFSDADLEKDDGTAILKLSQSLMGA